MVWDIAISQGGNMKYQSPYTITSEILNRVAAISFGLGWLSARKELRHERC